MNTLKQKNMMKHYTGFKGSQTVSDIKSRLSEELIKELTGKQLGAVMDAINKAYHDGRASTGAEMIDNNCVYINSINKMIEWNEEGAEYQQITETIPCTKESPSYIITKGIKIKDGILVPRFIE